VRYGRCAAIRSPTGHELADIQLLPWLCGAARNVQRSAAAAHLAPAVEWADLDGNLLIVDDPFRAVPVRDGRFVFSERPGLGVVPA